MTSRFTNRGFSVVALSGELSQNERTHALQAMRDGRARICIATDVAARGIDVTGVTHVINFDLPNEAEVYVHRIGRTARAGAEGTAISFCASDERDYLRAINALIRTPISVEGGGKLPLAAAPKGPRPARNSGPRRQNHQPRRRGDGDSRAA